MPTARIVGVADGPAIRRGVGVPTAGPGSAGIGLDRRGVRWAGERRGELSETGTALLSFLVANNKRAVSREELLTRVWGSEPQGLETRTIDMHIARLRTKLRDPSGKQTPEAIMTERAHGYMAGPDLVPLESTATAK